MPDSNNTSSPVETLRSRVDCEWPAIRKAQKDTSSLREHLSDLFRTRDSSDTTLALFGSVARQEVTSSSDLDWILLIDGQSFPEHKDQERQIEKTLLDAKYIEPGKSGMFGKMAAVTTWSITLEARTTSIRIRRAAFFCSWSLCPSVAARLMIASAGRFCADTWKMTEGCGTPVKISEFHVFC